MRVVQVSRPGGPFEMVEREIPQFGQREVRVKVQACGVCDSDSLTKEGHFPGITYPRVSGHEIAGVIDAVELEVPRWKIGRRAAGSSIDSEDTMKFSAMNGVRPMTETGFRSQDRDATEAVAIVSESTARLLFSGEDPIGQHIKVMSRAENLGWALVVGTATDVHQYALDDATAPAVYVLFAQYQWQGYASLVVRSTVPQQTLARSLTEAILSVDQSQPVFHLQPMSRYVALSLAQQTFALRVIAVFGVLALSLALAGVYGVVSHVVGQRAKEIGLRLALGATPTVVRRLVLRHVLAAALVGVCGGVLALVAGREVLARLLFSVSPLDAKAVAIVAVLLIVGACAAAYAPIVKAATADPASVLCAQ